MRVPGVPQLLSMLRQSAYPDEREWAVDHLATSGAVDSQVVQAVLTAASVDGAPTVRAAYEVAMGKVRARHALLVAPVLATPDAIDWRRRSPKPCG